MLDALCSLAEVSSGPNYNRPRLSPAVEPFISIKKGRHPCQELITMGHDFIPNDLKLGQGVSVGVVGMRARDQDKC